MAVDRRKANGQWNVVDEAGNVYAGSYQHSHLAVLMDIRDEIQQLNRLLHCANFIGIPATLRSISRKLPARKVKARK